MNTGVSSDVCTVMIGVECFRCNLTAQLKTTRIFRKKTNQTGDAIVWPPPLPRVSPPRPPRSGGVGSLRISSASPLATDLPADARKRPVGRCDSLSVHLSSLPCLFFLSRFHEYSSASNRRRVAANPFHVLASS
jgi:hypothetical protein